MLVAGGTDLLPNMKRRQQTPETLISLARVEGLKRIANGSGLTLGAGLTLTEVVQTARARKIRGLYQAAAQIATPHLRNMGTLGGNLCLDTRCTYYNQNEDWREAIGYCMKKDGKTCWVATASKRCLAVSSTDTAPTLIALGAKVRLVSAEGERELALESLYNNDGMDYLTRKPDEILTEVVLPDSAGWKSTYWKLRRRGSFDFPLLGVAVALRAAAMARSKKRAWYWVRLPRNLSSPARRARSSRAETLTDEVIAEAATLAASRAKPMDNTDLDVYWRKEVVPTFVGYALREIRGDDMRALRLRIARQVL